MKFVRKKKTRKLDRKRGGGGQKIRVIAEKSASKEFLEIMDNAKNLITLSV